MLSQRTQQIVDELQELFQQREEIDRRIEELFTHGPALAPQPAPSPGQPAPRRKGRKPKTEAQAEPKPRGKRPSRFTDQQIEQMIRESESGKSAAQIVSEYGFGSIATWYTIKSNYQIELQETAPAICTRGPSRLRRIRRRRNPGGSPGRAIAHS
jgi:hypothetical protein